jgi:hypothetical protein
MFLVAVGCIIKSKDTGVPGNRDLAKAGTREAGTISDFMSND